jgi:dUTP pyrophosphatase
MVLDAKVKRLHPDAQLPKYGRPGDAGLDLHAAEDVTLVPHEQRIVKTGIALAIPPGAVGLVWDRSGMAAKNGVKTMAGVIDHTYRGELGVVLVNVTNRPYDVKKGDRVAQLLVQPIHTADVQEVDDLDETNRGDGGFGSSGR